MTNSITPLLISPGVTPDTHPSIATGHSRSTFGPPAGATATDRLIERILARGSVRLRGIMRVARYRAEDEVLARAGRTARRVPSPWSASTASRATSPANMMQLVVWPSRQEDS